MGEVVFCVVLHSALNCVGLSLSFYMGILPWLVIHSLLEELFLSSFLSPKISVYYTVVDCLWLLLLLACLFVCFKDNIAVDFLSFKIIILTVNSFHCLCA